MVAAPESSSEEVKGVAVLKPTDFKLIWDRNRRTKYTPGLELHTKDYVKAE
jgi:hypothetical protein